MLLDLIRTMTCLGGVLIMAQALIGGLLTPGMLWQERLLFLAGRLVVAGCLCAASGLLFTFGDSSGMSKRRFRSTLPVRVLLWASLGVTTAFALSWLVCDLVQQAGPYVSNRAAKHF